MSHRGIKNWREWQLASIIHKVAPRILQEDEPMLSLSNPLRLKRMEKIETNKRRAAFVRWMGPILNSLRKLGGSATQEEVADLISDDFGIYDIKKEDSLKTSPLKFAAQIGLAGQYLIWEGLIRASQGKVWRLTEIGEKTDLTEALAEEIFSKWLKIIVEAQEGNTN